MDVFGSGNDVVIGLPGFDMPGRRGHGGDAPSRTPDDAWGFSASGTGNEWASYRGPASGKGSGKGHAVQALGDGPVHRDEATPLWDLKGWTAPGTDVVGRINAFRGDLDGSNPQAGWIWLADEGPDVYFKPKQLDRALSEFLAQDPTGRQLINRGVQFTLEYRRNGHHRHARGTIHFRPESGETGDEVVVPPQ